MTEALSLVFSLALSTALVPELGHDDFRRREAASAALRALDGAAVPALRRAMAHADPEVRHRARVLLDDWRGSFRPTAYPLTPWIDSLPDGYPDRLAVINRLMEPLRYAYLNGGTHPYWPEYREGTNILVDELIMAGWSKARVSALLDQMVEKEKQYIRNCGHEVMKPLLEDRMPMPLY